MGGLRKCWAQPAAATPKPVWNPDIDQPIDFRAGWQEVPDTTEYDNAFKSQWEHFLRHVAVDTPFPWSLREGAKGVQLAEAGLQSWRSAAGSHWQTCRAESLLHRSSAETTTRRRS